MSIATRLSRLAPSLTARERVVLVIRARNAGQEPDPEVLQMPESQRREYDQFVALCIATNVELGALLHIIQVRALTIERSLYPMRICLDAAAMVEAEAGIGPQPADRHWRKQAHVDSASFFRGVAEEQRHWLLNDALERWQELKAVEVAGEEIAAQFDGENPLAPALLSKANETEDLLRKLVAELAGKERKAPKASGALIELTRAQVRSALDYLGLRETR
jgi:hypothetical protein